MSYYKCLVLVGRFVMTEKLKNKTHFGYETILESEKTDRVKGVFGNVATKYDIMNDLMSLGVHRIWKDAMMDWLYPTKNQHLLDVAGGTGDVAFRFLKRAGDAKITILDLTEEMMSEGRQRAQAEAAGDRIKWMTGDAMALPFPDNSFDVYTISFGIRNVTSPRIALEEAYRVLRPGGRILILEFSHIPNSMLQWAYDRYSFNFIPVLGKIVANDQDSYQYLVESIRQFPNQDSFLRMIETAGFENTKYRNLSMGIACLHSGWKI